VNAAGLDKCEGAPATAFRQAQVARTALGLPAIAAVQIADARDRIWAIKRKP